jgi:hypothetical protein
METEKMTAEERARIIVKHCQNTDGDERPFIEDVSFVVYNIQQACSEAREEGKRDSIIEFCEGDRSMLAKYEQKAYQKGFLAGAAEMREKGIEERKFWINPLEVDPLVKEAYRNGAAEMRERAAKIAEEGIFLNDSSPEALFGKACGKAIRSLPLSPEP